MSGGKVEAKRAEGGAQAANVARGLRESALWVFGALALILFVALVSYDRADPAFSSTGQPGPVSNQIGPFGAWFSDLFFVLFGAPAFLFPVMLAIVGFRLFQDRRSRGAAGPALDRVPRGRVRAHARDQLRARDAALLRRRLPEVRGRRDRQAARRGPRLGAELPRRDAAAARLLARLLSLATGVSWLDVMDRIGNWALRGVSYVRGAALRAARRQHRQGSEAGAAGSRARGAEEGRRAEAAADRARRTRSRRASASRRNGRSLFERPGASELPPLSLLDDPPARAAAATPTEALEAMSRLVELKLRDFGVEVEVVAVQPGPVVTRFELRPAPGVKVSQISNLSKDLARVAVGHQRARRRGHSGQVRRWASRSRTRRARWSRSAKSCGRRPTRRCRRR